MRLMTIALAAAVTTAAARAQVLIPTFNKDVLPILQKNCQSCHRPGEAAPMSFLSYETTRPWAKAIKEAVKMRRMPPWPADPHVGKFTNDRSMPAEDIATLANWADSGAKSGNPKDAPEPMRFTDGWSIPTPDLTIELPEEYQAPSSGTIQYTYFIVPTGLTEDRWVQFAEARPGNRAIVHHIIAFIREPGSKWLRDYPVGKGFVPGRSGGGESSSGFLTGYAPGLPPEQLRPGTAKLLKAGSEIVFQMHYTANGKAQSDRSKVGIVWAREPVTRRAVTIAAQNNRFLIPPHADNHRVDAALTLHAESELIGLLPHMHLRGKAFAMKAVYPTGESEDLLSVPRYDFNWQLWYQLPPGKMLPKGTRIEAAAWFDNSRNNPHNPNPEVAVKWGDQSWEEMMMGFMNVSVPVGVDPRDVLRAPKPQPNATGGE